MNEPFYSLTIMLARGFALLIIGLGIYACLRKRSATAKNDFWRLVHVALVAIPLIGLLPSVWHLSLGPDLAPLAPAANTPLMDSTQLQELPPLIVDEAEEAKGRTSGRLGFGWKTNLLLLWAIGAASILTRFAVGYLKLLSLRRRCTPIGEDSPWQADLLKQRGSSINIFSGDQVPVPLIYGVFRPTLLLPTTILEASANERTMIVQHEMSHAKRGDGLFNLIRVIATALHWPNPLAWFAAKRLRLTEEQAVDDTVLASGCRPVLYAELLTTVATGAAFNLPAQAMAQPSSLRTRVTHVLSSTQDRRTPSGLLPHRKRTLW